MKTEIDVIFREETDGTVIAVFPHEVWDLQGNCTCYAHTGQHSACDYNYVLKETKPAKEFNKLKTELEGIGYDLRVIKCRNYDKYLLSYTKLHNKN